MPPLDAMLPFLWPVGMVAGFLLIDEGARLITDCAVLIARKTGYSRFVVGVLLVSFLAALPELLITLLAVSKGSTDLALGNVLGANIVDIGVIVGVSAVILPIAINREMVTRDAIFILTIAIISSALLSDGRLDRIDGLVLLLLFVPYSITLLTAGRTVPQKEIRQSLKDVRIELRLIGRLTGGKVKVRAGIHWLVIGIVLAVVGAELVTTSAIELSKFFGVSEWLIGITIVAVGGSLPDIAAAYHAARRGQSELALGIALGAETFTIIFTLGIVGLGFPTGFAVAPVVPALVMRVVLPFSLLLFMLTKWKVERWEGAVLLALFATFIIASAVAEMV